jgi:daunorubicin resistance ABC transporter ATP-binding subunit
VFGLLGPNGAGKTTLVRVLATLLTPDAGRAEVFGRDVTSDPQAVRELLGLTGQFAAVDEILSGRENLIMFGRLFDLPPAEARRRADELLERFDLADAADRPARTYSGGMRRRLDLASSLLTRPQMLFLDEPTTGLDPRSRNQIWAVVRELVRDGTTLLLTTQYLEEADELANRVGIIDDGRIVAEGTPRELKAQVGLPHLEVHIAAGDAARAEQVVARFGNRLPARDGAVLVELERGAAGVAPIVRALDDAGLAVDALELVEPTLDDVFVAKTGYHLEGADAPEAPVEASE